MRSKTAALGVCLQPQVNIICVKIRVDRETLHSSGITSFYWVFQTCSGRRGEVTFSSLASCISVYLALICATYCGLCIEVNVWKVLSEGRIRHAVCFGSVSYLICFLVPNFSILSPYYKGISSF